MKWRWVVAALTVLIAVGIGVARWTPEVPPGEVMSSISFGDSYYLLRNALTTLGVPSADAFATSREWLAPLSFEWVQMTREPVALQELAQIYGSGTDEAVSPRYVAIFEARPLSSWVLARLIVLFGPGALAVFTVGWGVLALLAAAALAVQVARAAGFRTAAPAAGLVAVLVLAVLPPGFWISRFLYEGASYATAIAAVCVAFAAAENPANGGRWWWLFPLSAGVSLFTRPSYAVPLIVGLSGFLLIGGALRHPRWNRMSAAGLGGLVALVAYQVVSRRSGWPGLGETLQDTFTYHFTSPDVPNPVELWVQLLKDAFPQYQEAAGSSLPLLLSAVVSVSYLVWRLRWLSVPVVMLSAVGLANMVVHPIIGEAARLGSIALVPVAVAVGLAIAELLARVAPSQFGSVETDKEQQQPEEVTEVQG